MTAISILVVLFLVAAAVLAIMSMTGKPGPLLQIAVVLICVVIAIAVLGKVTVG